MFLIKTTNNLSTLLEKERLEKKKIGFVATMGALHEGHISLLERSKNENDITVCSIFVNPRQFNDKNDLENYPRPIENDIKLLTKSGCDILFLPLPEEIYPENYQEPKIDLNGFDILLEGSMRPGHFKGVALVVKRLFDCVKPDKAYFGQKDFQQTLVIKQLVKQFHLPIEIIISKILREKNGLAMSSRNIRLSTANREEAGFIYSTLIQLKEDLLKMSLLEALNLAKDKILTHKETKLEYLEIVNPETLVSFTTFSRSQPAIALLVVNFNGVRLLDNIYL